MFVCDCLTTNLKWSEYSIQIEVTKRDRIMITWKKKKTKFQYLNSNVLDESHCKLYFLHAQNMSFKWNCNYPLFHWYTEPHDMGGCFSDESWWPAGSGVPVWDSILTPMVKWPPGQYTIVVDWPPPPPPHFRRLLSVTVSFFNIGQP